MRVVSVGFLVLRISAALWVLTVGVFAGLQTLGYLPPAPKLEPITWAISLAIIGLESVGAIVRDRFQAVRSRLSFELDRWSLLFVLEHLDDGHQTKGLAFEEIGVSVWVPTFWSRQLARLPNYPREKTRFRRLNRFRPQGFPQQTSMTWRGHMGTVGECWRSQKEKYWDAHLVAAKYSDADISDEQFSKLKPAITRGLSREQFTRIVGKYSEVRAVPIMHSDPSNGKMIGVLTVDRVFKKDETPFIQHLHDNATLRRAEAAASGAGSTVAGKRRDP